MAGLHHNTAFLFIHLCFLFSSPYIRVWGNSSINIIKSKLHLRICFIEIPTCNTLFSISKKSRILEYFFISFCLFVCQNLYLSLTEDAPEFVCLCYCSLKIYNMVRERIKIIPTKSFHSVRFNAFYFY